MCKFDAAIPWRSVQDLTGALRNNPGRNEWFTIGQHACCIIGCGLALLKSHGSAPGIYAANPSLSKFDDQLAELSGDELADMLDDIFGTNENAAFGSESNEAEMNPAVLLRLIELAMPILLELLRR